MRLLIKPSNEIIFGHTEPKKSLFVSQTTDITNCEYCFYYLKKGNQSLSLVVAKNKILSNSIYLHTLVQHPAHPMKALCAVCNVPGFRCDLKHHKFMITPQAFTTLNKTLSEFQEENLRDLIIEQALRLKTFLFTV